MSADDQVITPGGLRPAKEVHTVSPGQTVTETNGEPRVVTASNGDTNVATGLVLTPGGLHLASAVHNIKAGQVIDGSAGLRILESSGGAMILDLGPLEPGKPGVPLHPIVLGLPSSPRPGAVAPAGLGTGWITYASWTNNTGTPISSFATTWTVPPPPTTSDSQTIFLFSGIQNSTMIYQPVLQWGSSAAGGGAYWSVASWYVDGQGGPAFHSDLIQVQPGQVLVGIMEQTGHQAGTDNYSYNCYFQGIANTSLTVTNVQELTWAIETLECYGLTQESDYPDTFETAMRGISIKTGATNPAITWSPATPVSDIGQHTVVVSNSSTSGEVDLCYRPVPLTKQQGLAEFGSRLYASWKGETNDERLFFSSYDGTWTPQNLGPGGNTRSGVALAEFDNLLFAAWKGEHSDQRLFYSSYNGSNWAPQAQIAGVSSRVGPELAVYNGRLYAAWRGMNSDQAIWYASFDGAHWSAQASIPGVASSNGPSLAFYGGKLWAAWKGAGSDQRIWFATFDGTSWSAQTTINGVQTQVGPALATFNTRLYAIWKGMDEDQRLWYSSFDGHSWAAQTLGPPGDTGPDYQT